MKSPSIQTLSTVFSNPEEAKRIIGMTQREICARPEAIARIKECGNPPKLYELRMHCLNVMESSLHGVVHMMAYATDEWAVYLNAGGTYIPTLIYYDGRFRIQSVGDFVEEVERRGVLFK